MHGLGMILYPAYFLSFPVINLEFQGFPGFPGSECLRKHVILISLTNDVFRKIKEIIAETNQPCVLLATFRFLNKRHLALS